jgi:hypothetical protein
MKKGLPIQPMTYMRVIATDQIPSKDRPTIAAALKAFRTPTDVNQAWVDKGYSIKWDSHTNRIAYVLWRGFEVRLFFKRMVQTLTMLPAEITFAVRIQTDDQAWLSIDLLDAGVSANLIKELTDKITHLEQMLELRDASITQWRRVTTALETELVSTQETNREQRKVLAKGQKKVHVVNDPVVMTSVEIDDWLGKQGPKKLQAFLRVYLAHLQGLAHYPSLPDGIKPKIVDARRTKLRKMLEAARKAQSLIPYIPPVPPLKPVVLKPWTLVDPSRVDKKLKRLVTAAGLKLKPVKLGKETWFVIVKGGVR